MSNPATIISRRRWLAALCLATLALACGDSGGDTAATCARTCERIASLCGAAPPDCENACGQLTASERACVDDASSCAAIDRCGQAGTADAAPDTPMITRCFGPSCPGGECDDRAETPEPPCDGFDPDDAAALCADITGSGQFCYEVGGEGKAVDCSRQTPVTRNCQLGCGYNYAPYDCAICNEIPGTGCAF